MQLVLVGAPYSYTKLYHCKNINRVLEKQPEILIYIYIYREREREREREVVKLNLQMKRRINKSSLE